MVDGINLEGIAGYLTGVATGWEVVRWDGELRCRYPWLDLLLEIHIDLVDGRIFLTLTIIEGDEHHRQERCWQWDICQNFPDFGSRLNDLEGEAVLFLLNELFPVLQNLVKG